MQLVLMVKSYQKHNPTFLVAQTNGEPLMHLPTLQEVTRAVTIDKLNGHYRLWALDKTSLNASMLLFLTVSLACVQIAENMEATCKRNFWLAH